MKQESNKKSLWTLGAVVAVVLGLGLQFGPSIFDGDQSPAPHLKGRPWIDHVPKNPKDKVHVFFAAKDSPYGATVHGSNFRHLVNGIQHKLNGDNLMITTLQDNVRIKLKVKTWKCDEEAPGELDLCMELGVRHRKIRLYSASKWERSADTLPQELTTMGRLIDMGAQVDEDAVDTRSVTLGTPSWFMGL